VCNPVPLAAPAITATLLSSLPVECLCFQRFDAKGRSPIDDATVGTAPVSVPAGQGQGKLCLRERDA